MLPEASAGATLWHTMFNGELNAVMPQTTPRGTRIVNAMPMRLPGRASIGTISPTRRLPSSAETMNVCIARATSAVASVIGRPPSAVISAASSSRCALDQPRGGLQQDVALAADRAATAVERAPRGRDGGVDLLAPGAFDGADHRAGVLVGDLERPAGARVPLARRSGAGRARADCRHDVAALTTALSAQMTPLARRRCCSSQDRPSAP